jgi:hypothetical protein
MATRTAAGAAKSVRNRAPLPHHRDPRRQQILTAEDPLPPDLRDALALIK